MNWKPWGVILSLGLAGAVGAQWAVELANLSSRAWIDRGTGALIAGFVIEASDDGAATERVLIRAVGPELARPPFGVGDAVSATELKILSFPANEVIATNRGWTIDAAAAAEVRTLSAQLGAFAMTEGSADSALVVELPPGAYTAVVEPAGDAAPGTALLELYDAAVGAGPRLTNLSARARSSRSSPLVAGFVTGGDGEGQMLVRAVGPALAPYLGGTLDDPVLRLFDGHGAVVDREDNWSLRPTADLTRKIATEVGAFPVADESDDAGLVAMLPAGSLRTGIVTSTRGGEGVALIEVYRRAPQPLHAAPTGLAATVAGPGRLELSWDAVAGATTYELEVDGVTQSGVTSPFLHSGLIPESTHRYALRAVSADGLSATSAVVTATASAETASPALWGGANQWQLPQQSDAQRAQQLQAMEDAGLQVLRLWVSNRGDEAWQVQPTGWTYESPVGVFHEGELRKLDRMLAECAERGIRVIVSLANHANVDHPDGIYSDTYSIRSLYEGEGLEAYKRRVAHLLNRRNPYLNNRRWKDLHEVVLAWEVANESGLPLRNVSATSTERYGLHRKFLRDMAAAIKAEDPVSFVSAGIAGYARYYDDGSQNKVSSDDITILGDIPNLDIYTLHYYGGGLSGWISDVLPSIRGWGKKLIIEEFGNERRAGAATTIANYRGAMQPAREVGVPWLFWEMDLRKDDGTWGVMSDDAVWSEVIVPEAAAIRAKTTEDVWFR